VAAPSPLSYSLDGIRRLEDAGAAAAVMHSLFEEQIDRPDGTPDYRLPNPARTAEVPAYFPDGYNLDPDAYLDLIAAAKAAVDIPIFASLNGISPRGWIRYAQHIEQAGADGLEMNLYHIPTNPDEGGTAVEERYFRILRIVRETVSIPIAVKISPFFSSTANMALRLGNAGADGLVLFNRFYQADIDLETGRAIPHLELSSSYDLTLPLRWAAILYGRIPSDLAITSGVHTHEDVLKSIMVGARVVMLASELLKGGVERIGEIREATERWLEEHGYGALSEVRGRSSLLNVADPEAFLRGNYTRSLQAWAERNS
jgi:dihydroorotate dehydrogenase (fumarate)